LQVFIRKIGACRIVHQYPIPIEGAEVFQPLETGQYRVGTFSPACCATDPRVSRAAQHGPPGIVRCKGDHHTTNAGTAQKTAKGMFKNRAITKLQVLLGAVSSHATANAGSRNHHPERGRSVVHSVSW